MVQVKLVVSLRIALTKDLKFLYDKKLYDSVSKKYPQKATGPSLQLQKQKLSYSMYTTYSNVSKPCIQSSGIWFLSYFSHLTSGFSAQIPLPSFLHKGKLY